MTFGQNTISHHLLCSKNYTNQWYPLNIHCFMKNWLNFNWMTPNHDSWKMAGKLHQKSIRQMLGKHWKVQFFKATITGLLVLQGVSSCWKRTNCNGLFSGWLFRTRPNSDPKPRRSKNSTSMVIKRRPSAAWLELSCPRWIHFAPRNPTIETTPYPMYSGHMESIYLHEWWISMVKVGKYAIHWVSGCGFFRDFRRFPNIP